MLESTLETVPIASGDRRVVYHTRGQIEAPNRSHDGTYLVFNPGGSIQVLARLFGGQGTINVPSWSPDSSSIAFVSYRLANPVTTEIL